MAAGRGGAMAARLCHRRARRAGEAVRIRDSIGRPRCERPMEITTCRERHGTRATRRPLGGEAFEGLLMDQLVEEFGHPTFTAFPVIVARLLLAAAFGAAIGFEREWRNRPAGLRTHILVCVAAATFAILTIEIVHAPMFDAETLGDAVQVDPVLVAEAVTSGVACLAAGVGI